MEILFYISISFNVLFIYMLKSIYSNNKALRTEVNKTYELVQRMYSNLIVTVKKMKAIDAKQIFENNDHTGVIFKELLNQVTNLEKTFNTEETDG